MTPPPFKLPVRYSREHAAVMDAAGRQIAPTQEADGLHLVALCNAHTARGTKVYLLARVAELERRLAKIKSP